MSNVTPLFRSPEPNETQPGSVSGLETSGGGGNDGGMEARVAKLGAAVEHIQRDVGEIKQDIRETKTAWLGFKDQINAEFAAIRKEM